MALLGHHTDPNLKFGKYLMHRYTIGVSYSKAGWPTVILVNIKFKANFTEASL
jgi:hypothetical protein